MQYAKAVFIGPAAQGALMKGTLGIVHSVFERTFNVLVNDELIGIGRSDVARSPASLITDILPSTRMSSLVKKNDRVLRTGELLEIGSQLKISLEGVEIWLPKKGIAKPLDIEAIRNNLLTVERLVSDGRYEEGGGQLLPHVGEIIAGEAIDESGLNRVAKLALPHVRSLVAAVKSKDLDLLGNCTKKLVGLGPGLSPSADDLLVGFMSSLCWMANSFGKDTDYLHRANQTILASALGRTTLLSQQMLKHAAIGETNEIIEGFLEAMLVAGSDKVRKAASKVLTMGETSGEDTMVGILLGLRAWLNAYFA
ncbi:MAG: DUF2877 domain-containing protein [Candidatus Hadarchaeales archaeon]